ncbi:hypothetical protein DD177_002127, partial [Neisseria gonorrhoeae]
EEKRRFFAGWIHFRLLIRFDRLKKRFSLMLKGGLYRVPGGVSTQYGGLTKTGTGCPAPAQRERFPKVMKHRADRFRTIRTACGPPPCPDFC